MANLSLSPEGVALFEDSPELQPILEEFANRDSALASSYSGEILGSGSQATVYAVNDHLVERVTQYKPLPGHFHRSLRANAHQVMDRTLRAREFWLQNRKPDSRLYIPEYYAAAVYPDMSGAILLERIANGVNVSDVLKAARFSAMQIEVSGRLGTDNIQEIGEQVQYLLQNELSFLYKLVHITGGTNDEVDEENVVVAYDPRAGIEEIMLAAVDL
jgi:hypothetical protein